MIVVCAALGNAANAPFFVLGAVISKRSLGGAGAWALILSAFAAGSVIGGLATMRVKPRRPLLVGSTALLPIALPGTVLALGAPAVVIAAAAVLAGAGGMLFNALWETTLQQHVPPAALSRVSAYDWFGSLAVQPLGYAIVGPAASHLGTNATLYGAAAIMFGSCVAILSVPSVRELTALPSLPGRSDGGDRSGRLTADDRDQGDRAGDPEGAPRDRNHPSGRDERTQWSCEREAGDHGRGGQGG